MLRQTRRSRSGAVCPSWPIAVRYRDRKRYRCVSPAAYTGRLRRHFRSVLRFSSLFDYRHGDRQRIDGGKVDDGAASDNRALPFKLMLFVVLVDGWQLLVVAGPKALQLEAQNDS